jgi:hypothetical protein
MKASLSRSTSSLPKLRPDLSPVAQIVAEAAVDRSIEPWFEGQPDGALAPRADRWVEPLCPIEGSSCRPLPAAEIAAAQRLEHAGVVFLTPGNATRRTARGNRHARPTARGYFLPCPLERVPAVGAYWAREASLRVDKFRLQRPILLRHGQYCSLYPRSEYLSATPE